MNTGLTIFLLYLLAIVFLLFTVTIHEIGHYLVGRWCKVNVKEISIGVGPTLRRWTTKNQLRVSLKLIPLVAYVLFDSKQLRSAYAVEYDNKNYSWYMAKCPQGKIMLEDAKTWQHVLILLAGVAMNFLAFFIIWPLCWLTWKLNSYESQWTNPFISLGYSFKAIGYCMVFKGGAGENIFIDLPDVAESSQWGLITFYLLLQMNLITGVFNLIPFPPLDGWKICTTIYEKKTGKQVGENFELVLTIIGCGLVLYIFLASILVKWVHW